MQPEPSVTPTRIGPFVPNRLLGRGGMGEVWAAHHTETGQQVAVKVLTLDVLRLPSFVEAFTLEIRAQAALRHPHVVPILDAGRVGGPEEAVPQTLAERRALAIRPSGGQSLAGAPWFAMPLALTTAALSPPASWPELEALLSELLAGLAHVHAHGIVHRDIKLGNLLLMPSLTRAEPVWRIADFGIAWRADASAAGFGTIIVGTPATMAPEQRGRWREQGPWTDLHAVGAVAWQLATGLVRTDAPFRPRMAVPEGFDAWLGGCLDPSPTARFQTAADAAAALLSLPSPEDLGPIAPVAVSGTDTTAVLPTWHAEPSDLPSAVPPSLRGARGGAPKAELPPSWRQLGPRAASARARDPWEFGPERAHALPMLGLGLVGLRSLPLIGREREQDALWDVLADVSRRRQPSALALHGPPGVGTTRLGDWLAVRAAELGVATVLRVGTGGLRQAVRSHLRAEGLTGEALSSHLEQWVEQRAVPGAAVGSLLALIGSDNPPEDAFARGLGALGWDRTLLVWVDDADERPGWEERARRLCRGPWPGPHGLMVLLGCRTPPEDLPSVEVAPLSGVDVYQIAVALLDVDGALLHRLVSGAEGRPAFVVDTVRAWAAAERLVASSTGFRLKPGVEPVLPDDLLQARAGAAAAALSALASDERTAIGIAAVIGADADRETVERAWAAAGLASSEGLWLRLQAAGFASGGRLADAWTREAILGAFRDTAALHRAAAAAAADDPSLPRRARWAEHRLLGSGDEEAVGEALKIAARCSDAGSRIQALHLLATTERVLDDLGRPASDPARCELRRVRTIVEYDRGNLLLAESLAAELEADCERHGWSARAEVAYIRGNVASRLGDHRAAGRHLRRALATARASGQRVRVAMVQQALAFRAFVDHRLAECAQRCREALADLDPTRRSAIGSTWGLLGAALLQRGDLEGAAEATLNALGHHDASGYLRGRAAARYQLADIRIRQCRLDEAAACLDEAALLLQEDGGTGELAIVEWLRGDLAVARRDEAEAEAAYRRALGLSAEHNRPMILRSLLHLHRARGEHAPIRAALPDLLQTDDPLAILDTRALAMVVATDEREIESHLAVAEGVVPMEPVPGPDLIAALGEAAVRARALAPRMEARIRALGAALSSPEEPPEDRTSR